MIKRLYHLSAVFNATNLKPFVRQFVYFHGNNIKYTRIKGFPTEDASVILVTISAAARMDHDDSQLCSTCGYIVERSENN